MKIQTKSETKAKTAPGTGKVSEGTGMQQAPELVLGQATSYPALVPVSEFEEDVQALAEPDAGKAKSRKKTAAIQDSGERTVFPSGAARDMHAGKGRMDLLPWEAILEVSKHCEEGALKYGERGCEKGIPIHSLVDSAFRHLAKYTAGETNEPHLRAAAWNILFALYMEIRHPEMQDIPARMKDGGGKP